MRTGQWLIRAGFAAVFVGLGFGARTNASQGTAETSGPKVLAGSFSYYPGEQQIGLQLRARLLRTPDGEPGLRARFYPNKNVKGEAVHEGRDGKIDFRWGGGAPVETLPSDSFSVRWSGTFGPVPQSGEYRFRTGSDDGMRVWLGGEKIIDDWRRHIFQGKTTTVTLEKGQKLPIREEFFEAGGGAACRFSWSYLGRPEPDRRAEVKVRNEAGERFVAETIRFAALGSHHRIDTGRLPSGRYTAHVTASGETEGLRFSFRHEDFVWEGNALGTTNGVPDPFEPIRVEDGTARVVLRRLERTPLGLWAQVRAKGQDRGAPFRPLLSEPIGLVTADGTRLEGERVGSEVSDKRLIDRGRAGHPSVTVETKVITSYDGCARVELTLKPGTAKKRLDGLTLEIPLRPERAALWHAVGNGIRGNPAGALPAGEGRIWDSREGPQYGGHHGSFAADSFVPYVWVGGPSRGLCFFADHARNWVLAEGKPCLSLHREEDAVVLRLHLVQRPVTLKKKRTITFGLMASPGKPMPENWRRWLLANQWHFAGKVPGYETVDWMGSTYWGAAQTMRETYPLGRDFSVLSKMQEARLTGDRGAWRGFLKAWSDRNLSDYEPRGRHSKKKIRKLVRGPSIRRQGRIQPDRYTVYWEEFFSVSRFHPESRIYRDEWNAGFGKIRFRPGGESYVNFQCWYGAEFLRRGVGLYFDNTFPKLGYNPVTSTAYRDETGTIHPSARMWWMRRYFRRIWNLHRQLAPAATKPVMMHHMTNGHLVPQLTYGQTNLDLEWHYGKKAFQKRFAPDLLRAESLGLQSGNVPFALAQKRGATVTRFGGLMVHEVRAWFTHERAEKMMEKLLRFGYGRGAEVVNYWDEDAALAVEDERCKWLLLKKGQKRMLLLCTWSPEKRDVRIEPSGPVTALEDAESGNALEADGAAFKVEMPGHGVRLLRWRAEDAENGESS